ncbi:MAG: tetratricopeptide repeat protein [Candidatus Binataceae bacterium]
MATLVLMAAFAIQAALALEAESREEVCDPTADYFLGMEDYSEAIAAHRRFLESHPGDALAHYHLGFAYGMVGHLSDEITEYRKAEDLGLGKWDLFLNMGLAYLEENDLRAAVTALHRAVVLGPRHPEAHYNLALAYERVGKISEARDELLKSLRLDPDQPAADNMLGAIYAELGDFVRARSTWVDLCRRHPDFTPARENLTILWFIEAEEGTGTRARHPSASNRQLATGTSLHDSRDPLASERTAVERPVPIKHLSWDVHD